MMLGVVLWSDASDRKAVIWCEDQGDLAFVTASDGYDELLYQDSFFDAGDLVQFDMKVKNATRRACNTRLVVGKIATALPDVLRKESEERPQQTAEVIAFSGARIKSSMDRQETENFSSVAGG